MRLAKDEKLNKLKIWYPTLVWKFLVLIP